MGYGLSACCALRHYDNFVVRSDATKTPRTACKRNGRQRLCEDIRAMMGRLSPENPKPSLGQISSVSLDRELLRASP
jgi:hypothetical protein